MKEIRLGVNIDHIATLRNARGEQSPNPIDSLKIIERAGAKGVTIHLREDRRHIKDKDAYNIKRESNLPVNLEIAATDEMVQIACNIKPNACCIVPEKREEITTEGGLDVLSNIENLKAITQKLKNNDIRVSLFIDAEKKQIEAANKVGADIIEFHTGEYSNKFNDKIRREEILSNLKDSVELATKYNIECHAGHGLNYDNVKPIAEIKDIIELNIGHFLIGNAIFCGLENSVKKMINLMNQARL